MTSRWTEKLLGAVITLQRGFDLPERERSVGEVPIVSSSGITGYHSSAKVSPPGVVTGRYGTLGEVFYIDTDFWPLNTTLWVKDFKDNDPRYVSYLLRSLNLGHQNSAGAVPGLNRIALHMLSVRVPSRSLQELIAGILSGYEDLIENNTRRIKILEQMARMLYREWFVNFRFPGHEKVKMVKSELGLAPEGWSVGALSDAIILQRGFDLPKHQRLEGGIPIYAATGIIGTQSIAKVKAPGVVTGRSGSLGSVSLVLKDFWPLNTVLWVKEFKRSSAAQVYFLLKELKLGGLNSGAAVPTLNRNDVHELPTILPPASLLEKFEGHAMPLLRLKETLMVKNENLRATRDLLLPKLVSGEISIDPVPTLEKEAATV